MRHIKILFVLLLFLGLAEHSISQSLWKQKGQLLLGENSGDAFGREGSISSNGKTMAFGAIFNSGNGTNSGHVRVYEFADSLWLQKGLDIDGESGSNYSGCSVSLSADGDKIAIGAYSNPASGNGGGHARVFEWDGNNWIQVGNDIDALGPGDDFGWSVELARDSMVLAVGSPGYNNDRGNIRVFDWTGNNWVQRGNQIDGLNFNDKFGNYVNISDNGLTVAIGTYFSNVNGNFSGQVRIFEWDGLSWIQKGQNLNGGSGDRFGNSLQLSSDGNTLVVGSPLDFFNYGSVIVFEWNGSLWIQKGNDIYGNNNSELGYSVSISGDGHLVAAGGPFNQNGLVQVYQFNGTDWSQIIGDIQSDSTSSGLGYSVNLARDSIILAVGSPSLFSNGFSTGGISAYELCSGIDTTFISRSGCNSYFWPLSNITYPVSGMYQAVTKNSIGCDSLIILNLSITTIDPDIFQAGNALFAEEIDADSYQWLKCVSIDSFQLIPGATSKFYTPAQSGSFALVLTKANCTDTSACFSISISNLKTETNEKLRLFPNPSSGKFRVSLPDNQRIKNIQLLSSRGKILPYTIFTEHDNTIKIDNAPAGIYLLKIWSATKQYQELVILN